MSFKTITCMIKKDEIKNNTLLVKKFILESDSKSVIIGKVSNKENKAIPGCAVILQEYDKDSDESVDKNIAFTNSKGYYGISTILKTGKNYKIVVYAPNKIN